MKKGYGCVVAGRFNTEDAHGADSKVHWSGMQWLIYASLSAATAALVAIFGKIGLKNVDPTLATTVRAGVMFACMVAASFALKKFGGLSTLSGKPLLMILLAGLAGAASWLFYFMALKSGSASNVASVDRLSVVLVIIMAALFLGEKFTAQVALGAVLMTVGAVLVIR